MKGVFIFLAEGFEDMEALGTRDVLLRGGVPVKTVSVSEDYWVESSHGLTVIADMNRQEFEESLVEEGTSREDVMIFPGGMPGSRHLSEDGGLMLLMKKHYEAGGALAAICAAPGLVLSQLGSGLSGKRFTCFDGFEKPLQEKGAVFTPESSVTDGRIITGRGAGHAVNFGLAILRYLKGDQVVEKVRSGLML